MTTFVASIVPFGLLISLWLTALWWLRRRKREDRPWQIDPVDLQAGGLLFLVTLAFFWRTLSGDVYQPADGGDLVSFLYPTYRFASSQISQGSLPLWNPHLYGGAPFISDIQAGFLYLPNIILFVLNPEFDYRIMQLLSQLHIFWAGLGMYVLIRSLSWQRWQPSAAAAFLGAVAFQFSDPLLIHLGNLNLIAVLSWLPWIMAAFHRGLSRTDMRWSTVAAILFSVANYAGHAQSSVYIGMGIGLYWLWRVFDSWSDSPRRSLLACVLRDLRYLLVTLGLTLLLTAPILLPAVEMTQYTERADLSYQETIAFSLAPTQAIGLLTPSFFGRGPALHWSLWDRVETPYAGLITLLFATLGLLFATSSQRKQILPWFGVALFGFVTALGVYSILHGWLTLLLPGFDQFRAPARALILWTFGLSIVAAFGVDAVQQTIRKPTKSKIFDRLWRYGTAWLLGIVIPLAYFSLLVTQESEAMFLRASVAALALSVSAFFWLSLCALVAAYRARWMQRSPFGFLCVVLLFAELSANGGAYLDVSESDPTSGYNHAEIIAFLQGDPDYFRIDTRTDIQAYWQPDSAALHGLQDVWGIANPLLLEPWKTLWDVTGGRHSQLYDMLNVKYVLVEDGVPLPENKFELVLDAPQELSVYQNRNFMPRAWIVHQSQAAANNDEAFVALRHESFDPTESVILTGGGPLTSGEVDEDAVAQITHYGSSEMTINVRTSFPGYLVLSEVWYPGWQATISGAASQVLRANGTLRAIFLPAGESTVHLWFAPRGWFWGLMGSILGLIICAVLLWRHAPAARAPK